MVCNIKSIATSVLAMLYPPLCIHCKAGLNKRIPLFCSICLEQISLAEIQGRCRTCFVELDKGRCERCCTRSVVIHRQLAACDAVGPGSTLFHALHQGKRECVPAVASLMAYQWLEQKMPLPNFLIPLPISFWQRQRHGIDVNLLLAKELSRIFSVPVISALRRKFDRVHFLTQGEIRANFQLKRNHRESFCDAHIVLISPKLEDGALRLAGTVLRTCFPSQIDALALL